MAEGNEDLPACREVVEVQAAEEWPDETQWNAAEDEVQRELANVDR